MTATVTELFRSITPEPVPLPSRMTFTLRRIGIKSFEAVAESENPEARCVAYSSSGSDALQNAMAGMIAALAVRA